MNDGAGSLGPRAEGPRAQGAEHGVVMPKTAARQGVTGHNVRYVLIISTVGAVVALTLAYYFVFS
jgi:hypothetical protein